ncbi:hypothetical protein COHA_009268 [Chlorella ohadii]|uniref:Uncharacterized protein n=1 Tax=Chlorella ohadii TaxID=2649997 RepID=A0AAD5DHG5_9CHLO|nr:hypothetical protein COHA_009268 [Chlorella ohadii]
MASTITQQQLRVEIAALTAELSSSIEQSVQLLQPQHAAGSGAPMAEPAADPELQRTIKRLRRAGSGGA